jgi:hypothetical protein
MLCFLLYLSIHPLQVKKLAIPIRVTMCKAISSRWVPSCSNHAACADYNFSNGENFNDSHYMEKGPHLTYLLSISSWFFTAVFSVDTRSLKCDASSTPVPICASTCTEIHILSLLVNHFSFPLLSIFHRPSVKFFLIGNKIWSLWSHMGTGRLKNLTWVHFCWMFHLWKHTQCVAMVIFWNTNQTWERYTALIELQLYWDPIRSKLF